MIAALLLAEIGEPEPLESKLKAFQTLDPQTKVLVGTALIDLANWHPTSQGLTILEMASSDTDFVRSLRLAAADAALACECPAESRSGKLPAAMPRRQETGRDWLSWPRSSSDSGLEWHQGWPSSTIAGCAGEAFGQGAASPHATDLLDVKSLCSRRCLLADHCRLRPRKRSG